MNRLPFAVGLIAIVVCCGLHAQSVTLQAKIPFEFRLGDTLMPAGEYQWHYSASMLVVKEQGGSYAAATTLPIHTSRREAVDKGTLLFNRYGDTYFFTKLWAAGSLDGLELPQGSWEKRIVGRAGHAPQTPITIQTN
jgi:hypothetical protein